jgi:hypothetical protein
MKIVRKFAVIMLFGSILSSKAQVTEGFENAMFDTVKLLNGSDGGRFHYLNTGEMTFPVSWDTAYKYWASGWAMSKIINNKVEPSNYAEHLYSAAPGYGVENGNKGKTFMVGQNGSFFYLQRNTPGDFPLKGFYVSNSTYAYNSMKFGDFVGKKFGGKTGKDEDSFVLIIRCYKKSRQIDSQRVILADFRFTDSAKDYILNQWKFITIKDAFTDSLAFELVSSDVGQFGMNTPAFFVLDGVEFFGFNSVRNEQNLFSIFPVPAHDVLNVKSISPLVSVKVLDYAGQVKYAASLNGFTGAIPTNQLPQGYYIIQVNSLAGKYSSTIQITR